MTLKTLLALLFFSVNVACLNADDAKIQKVYDGIMSDTDLYAGEGVVTLASFGGDINKAKASGRERARSNMVESIRVRIVSKTTDTQSSGTDGTKEQIQSESSSSADIELEGIQYKYLDEFPKEGQLTVLAFLSKEEYQRQSDKRMLGYRPLRALRLSGGVVESLVIGDLQDKHSGLPPGGVYTTQGGGGSVSDSQASLSLGVDFYWSSLFFGATLTSGRTPFTVLEAAPNVYRWMNSPWSVTSARVGYEYTPWAKRFQVAFPMQVEFAYLNWDPYFATGYGVAGGLSLRYWATDRMAFDVTGRWHHGLNKSDVATRDGKALLVTPSTTVEFNTTGPEITAGLLWNGF